MLWEYWSGYFYKFVFVAYTCITNSFHNNNNNNISVVHIFFIRLQKKKNNIFTDIITFYITIIYYIFFFFLFPSKEFYLFLFLNTHISSLKPFEILKSICCFISSNSLRSWNLMNWCTHLTWLGHSWDIEIRRGIGAEQWQYRQ